MNPKMPGEGMENSVDPQSLAFRNRGGLAPRL